MTVPSETTRDEVTSLRGIATDDVFDGASSDMAIVRSACGEGRSIVEGVGWKIGSFCKLLFEGVDISPILKYKFFFFGEVESFGS